MIPKQSTTQFYRHFYCLQNKSSIGVGAFAFAPFTEYLLKTFGWKVTLIILAAIILQCCWCGALIKPLKPTKRPKQSV